MNRRGFFSALLALPALLKAKPKPAPRPRVLYMDTDSVVWDRPLTELEVRYVFKYQMNLLYGKFSADYSGEAASRRARRLLGVYKLSDGRRVA